LAAIDSPFSTYFIGACIAAPSLTGVRYQVSGFRVGPRKLTIRAMLGVFCGKSMQFSADWQ